MKKALQQYHMQLVNHPIHKALKDINALRTFMEYHVFAVWDFMSLLKGLQTRLTSLEIPWRPSPFKSDIVRLINEIVLCEESDLNNQGHSLSHFELYLKAMEEVGANTSPILDFLNTPSQGDLPPSVQSFISYHLNLAINGTVEEIAASFFFGREKLLPELFSNMTKTLKTAKLNCPTLIYYFERHIELDGDKHGPLAEKCLHQICQNDRDKTERANKAAIQSLQLRQALWDQAWFEIQKLRNDRGHTAPQIVSFLN